MQKNLIIKLFREVASSFSEEIKNELREALIESLLEKLIQPTEEKTPTSAPGESSGWLYWIYPTDTYADGYSPKDSPYFCQILSKFGEQFISEKSSANEAISTISQLKNFHPGGKWDLTKPLLNFEPYDEFINE